MTVRLGVRDLKIWQHHPSPGNTTQTVPEFSEWGGFILLRGLGVKGLNASSRPDYKLGNYLILVKLKIDDAAVICYGIRRNAPHGFNPS